MLKQFWIGHLPRNLWMLCEWWQKLQFYLSLFCLYQTDNPEHGSGCNMSQLAFSAEADWLTAHRKQCLFNNSPQRLFDLNFQAAAVCCYKPSTVSGERLLVGRQDAIEGNGMRGAGWGASTFQDGPSRNLSPDVHDPKRNGHDTYQTPKNSFQKPDTQPLY